MRTNNYTGRTDVLKGGRWVLLVSPSPPPVRPTAAPTLTPSEEKQAEEQMAQYRKEQAKLDAEFKAKMDELLMDPYQKLAQDEKRRLAALKENPEYIDCLSRRLPGQSGVYGRSGEYYSTCEQYIASPGRHPLGQARPCTQARVTADIGDRHIDHTTAATNCDVTP